ncbi:MMPL family transporter [Sanguibacter inulinus]|uniref:MMPL family transporter n=1 Tax=Sanguibacter inulinus TaxID=60922 RepID=A0A853EPW1_9MICO|nr:MMPL family transporter [Sanguibacter inulinus]NYS92546.1 MMPL family transporter [Sanguibacter inulinus]
MLASVFENLGRRVSDHPRTTISVWAVLTVLGIALALFGVHGESLFSRLTTGDPTVAGSESSEGQEILAAIGDDGEDVTLIVDGLPPTADGVAEALQPALAAVLAVDGVETVLDPVSLPDGPTSDAGKLLTAADGDGFVVIVSLDPALSEDEASATVTAVVTALDATTAALQGLEPAATGLVGSTSLIIDAITHQVEQDLATGEAVALPVALLIMVLVFGGFLAAAMPMAGALASIGTGLGVLLGLSYLMEVDASIVNVVTVLGLGLSIDYGLLIVSRFREELTRLDGLESTEAADAPRRRSRKDTRVADALVRTMATAGRTVAFSALTVAISIAGLMVFRPDILRAIGAGGLSIILVAVATALTLVPALLRLAGRRLVRPGLLTKVPGADRVLRHTAAVDTDEGVFSRLAARVQRRPAWVAAGCVVVLLGLASPVLGLQMRNSGIEMLPTSSDQRQFVTRLAEQFPSTTSPEIVVVAQAPAADVAGWAADVAEIEGVDTVGAPTTEGEYSVVGVTLESGDAGGEQAVDVVTSIRDLDPAFATWVTGQAAAQVDFVSALGDRVWWAVAIVVLATFVLLFLMTGSVVIPLKALLTNAISISASMGILVWVFQEGHLSGLLGFTSTGGIETFVVALVVAFAFGLAMDYEVFLLSRIKELYDEGVDPETSVRLGLQRSGRIITSAAAIIIVVFAGFVLGDLLIIKQVGFALAVAVFIDATLVRMLLVPATMTLLGRWNWWAPAPLRRLHERLAIIH